MCARRKGILSTSAPQAAPVRRGACPAIWRSCGTTAMAPCCLLWAAQPRQAASMIPSAAAAGPIHSLQSAMAGSAVTTGAARSSTCAAGRGVPAGHGPPPLAVAPRVTPQTAVPAAAAARPAWIQSSAAKRQGRLSWRPSQTPLGWRLAAESSDRRPPLGTNSSRPSSHSFCAAAAPAG